MWKVIYHPEVVYDLERLGYAEAKRILQVIDKRFCCGYPDKIGKFLRGELNGCQRVRVGNTRIVYKINKQEITVLIIAVGMRREEEVYHVAEKRV
jgi:mRNA interferase RelE/StbE